MEFALSTAQVIACVIVAAAVSVITTFFVRRTLPKYPEKITVRVLGSVTVAEPGDVMTIALEGRVSDEEYERIKEAFQPVIDLGVKVGVVENANGVAVARGRLSHAE